MLSIKSPKRANLNERHQYFAFLILSLFALILALIIYLKSPQILHRFIGDMHPLIVIFIIIILGFLPLPFLLSKTQFLIYQKRNFKGLMISAALASIFSIFVIIADFFLVYPADINITFPVSLIFYPAIGYFAEILFHLLSLSIVIFISTTLFRKSRNKKIIWISIIIVSFIEPIYQIIAMGVSNQYSLSILVHTGLNVFLINLSQLIIFKYYDFISMYFFRLVYYLFWHILWGYLRLEILFQS